MYGYKVLVEIPGNAMSLASFQKRPSKSALTEPHVVRRSGRVKDQPTIVSDLEKECPEQHCDVVGCDEEVQ